MKSILIGILSLGAKVSAQEELKCYECFWDKNDAEISNPDCIDNLSPSLISTCPQPPSGSKSACTVTKLYRKSTQELNFVSRQCMIFANDQYEEGCRKDSQLDIEIEVCVCDEDECNDKGPSEEATTPKEQGISCYKCFWGEGDSDSDEKCLNSPSDQWLIPCPEPPSDDFKYACGLAKGFEKGTKNMIILNRMGCLFFPKDEYEDVCRESEEVSDGVEIDAETCFCDEDKCNGDQPSSATIQKMAVFIPILSIFISKFL